MIRRILDKRGSHIEMVLSFVVFVTFLIFLYSIITPSIKKQKDKDYLLGYLEDKITEKVMTDLDYYSLSIKETEYDKYLLDMPEFLDNKIVIKNSYDEIAQNRWYLKEGHADNYRWIIEDPAGRTGIRNFKLYYSESLPVKNPSPIYEIENGEYLKLSNGNYYFEFIRREKLIYNGNLQSIQCSNDIQYETLREEFNIPTGRDFAFKFDGGLSYTCNINNLNNVKGINVYSEEIPILYFDSNANINRGLLTVYIW